MYHLLHSREQQDAHLAEHYARTETENPLKVVCDISISVPLGRCRGCLTDMSRLFISFDNHHLRHVDNIQRLTSHPQ
jgi:hypothetical protein